MPRPRYQKVQLWRLWQSLSGWWRPNKGDPNYEKRWITFSNYCQLLLANSTSENPLRLLQCHLHSGLEDISTEHGKFFLSCGSATIEQPELLNYRPGFHDMVPASFQTCTWKHLHIQIGSCTSVYLICKWRDGFFFFFIQQPLKLCRELGWKKFAFLCFFCQYLENRDGSRGGRKGQNLCFWEAFCFPVCLLTCRGYQRYEGGGEYINVFFFL